ncbi:protein translocase subunit SecD [Atopobium minutum]|uniref:Protein translocase subunit SecD n=1 Tax=Atopobium minutum 10063974 TaxID=997872 RepID=N2BUL4_9ACTN|nr:protein translocase subunit SecD [Atopobium minutum]EMZ42253.1 protein-export membrane protein SecD [Atopobium minutum 10063974]
MAHKKSQGSSRTGINRWDTSAAPKNRRSSSKFSSSTELRKWTATLIALLVICVACVIGFTPLNERITQGLDIQGGVSVIMTASKADGSAPSDDDMQAATSIVQNRVNSLGASEATVQKQGNNAILIQIPGATDAQQAVETIGKTGYLEFVRLDTISDADALSQLSSYKEDVTLKKGSYSAFMDGSSIASVQIAQQSNSATGAYVVNLSLTAEGAKKFAEVTSELAPTKGRIAIVLDGVVKSAPSVQNEITDGNVSISGNFTADSARALKTVLDSGSLPVTLNYSESRVVGPTLGQDSLHQGLFAIALGMAIVILYLFVFYKGLGILTLGSLASFAIMYLGLLAVLSHFGAFALSLPGLAGIVLTIGMAADSSILVLERFREEIRMGKSIRTASLSGVKHGIGTSLDADMVTMVSALALFFFAVGPVKGFGLTLGLGIVCDVITMFMFKAPALRLLARGPIAKHPGFWGVSSDVAEANKKQPAPATKGGVAHA